MLDESGDRKYFTIIPNYIVNHSTPYEQAIYLYMKRVAGESGTCWTSAQEIAKKLQCSRNTIVKYRNKLVKRGWIAVIGHKRVGATQQATPEYKIVDLWDLNAQYYSQQKKPSNNDTLEESHHVVTESRHHVTSTQKDATAHSVDGAAEKLAAAENLKKRLELILEGEAPYDIFVRWKPIDKQPIGWDPDLNDGVRLNIRPFLSVPDVGKKGAGVLRDKPNINWNKDRGKDVVSAPWYHLFNGDRMNDYHISLQEKRNARAIAQKEQGQ